MGRFPPCVHADLRKSLLLPQPRTIPGVNDHCDKNKWRNQTAADSILAQRLSQVDGVAQVQGTARKSPPCGSASIRRAGRRRSVGRGVATAIRNANVTGPVGGFEGPDRAETIGTNGQLFKAADYRARC